MRRLAEEDIKLSDGKLVPKGTSLLVFNETMWDPSVYPNPETFILLKYDIKLAKGCKPTMRMNGLSMNADYFAKVSVKRRQEETLL